MVTEVSIREAKIHWLELLISGHRYLAEHTNQKDKEYHRTQTTILNKEYREIKGHYYVNRSKK